MRKSHPSEEITGTFLHVIYSPHGTIEGVIVQGFEGIGQLVFSDDNTGDSFRQLAVGTSVVAQGEFTGWSSTKKGGHRVFSVANVTSINGRKPRPAKAGKRAPVYAGKVVALNYARHGEANGVILDSGDFIHMKPEGYKRLKLTVGDAVEAHGDAYELHAEHGYVVEAHRVNGKKIH